MSATTAAGGASLPTLASIEEGVQMLPPKIVIYGVPGVGKTTFASNAPKPIILPTEEGIGKLAVPRFPLLRTHNHVIEALRLLCEEEVPYETVVLDSVDCLEPILWARVKQMSGKRVEDHGYGKGYLLAAEEWKSILGMLDRLRDEKGMGVILIGHSEVKTFQSPEHDPYDRYVLRLQRRAQDIVSDWADALLFANYKVLTVKAESGRTSVTRGIGTGQRVLHTTQRPAFVAKNRYDLPDELPLDYQAFACAFAGQGKD